MNKNKKIIIGVGIIIGVIGICRYLLGFTLIGTGALYAFNSSKASPQYFITVNELLSEKDEFVDKPIRISGAVIGESIEFDEVNGKLTILIADVPADYEQVEQRGGLAVVLRNAVNDPNSQKIEVVYFGERPELLQNMVQAILTGKLHSDGIFYADEFLLKCPSRYEEAVPAQAIN